MKTLGDSHFIFDGYSVIYVLKVLWVKNCKRNMCKNNKIYYYNVEMLDIFAVEGREALVD